MKTIIYYEASDRKLFYDKQECEKHEAFLKECFPAKFFANNAIQEEVFSLKGAGFLVVYRRDFLDLIEDKEERENIEAEITGAGIFLPCLLVKREDGKWQKSYEYLYKKRDECVALENAIEAVKLKYWGENEMKEAYCGFYPRKVGSFETIEKREEKNFWNDFPTYRGIAVYDARKFLEDAKVNSIYYDELKEAVDVNISHPQFITFVSFFPVGVYDLIKHYEEKIKEVKKLIDMMEEA